MFTLKFLQVHTSLAKCRVMNKILTNINKTYDCIQYWNCTNREVHKNILSNERALFSSKENIRRDCGMDL